MKKIVIYGAGGCGREVASIIEVLNSISPRYSIVGFVDDTESFRAGDTINGYSWLGQKEWLLKHKDEFLCVCAIGTSHNRAVLQKELSQKGVQFETIIAYGTYIGPYSKIGNGCILYGGITISANCVVGDGVLLNQGCNIGHDSVIGDFTSIMPGTGISGGVKIGSEVSIGGHAFIIPGRKIGDNAVIAAGSVVFTNVKAGTTVLGNPARRIKEIE